MRGFLKEIKNTAINRATNRINSMVSEALGGATGLPRRTGSVIPQNAYGKMDFPFDGKHISYPEDLGSADQSHYLIFEIHEQENANVKFPGRNRVSSQTTEVEKQNLAQNSATSQNEADYLNAAYGDFGGGTADSREVGSTLSIPRAATKKLKSSIALYMPATVSVNQASQYGEVEMGAVATIGANIAKNIDREGFLKGFFKSENVETSAGILSEAKEQMVKKTVDVFAAGASAAYDIFRGKVTNNRLEMVFQGIGRRTFSFSFKMMPKSESEAINVDEIVKMFRFYMAPSFDGPVSTSRTMIVPATFKIKYMFQEGENQFLNRISTCVLESCNVTYGGERVQFFRPTADGKGAPPVETQIDLQFKELEIITREKLRAGF
tara:strand:+ start:693 stop:1832 length:1140 start_codon:yes stop_codon:yes gene_type:complete